MKYERPTDPWGSVYGSKREFQLNGQALTPEAAILFTIDAKKAAEIINEQTLAFIIYNCRDSCKHQASEHAYPDLDLFNSFSHDDGWYPEMINTLNRLEEDKTIRATALGYELSETGRGEVQGIKYPDEAHEILRTIITKSIEAISPPADTIL